MAISPRILSRRINFSVVRVSIFLMLLMGLSFFLKEALISTFKNNLILNSLILGTFSVGIILSLRNLYSLRCGARWIESAQKEEKGDLAQSSHAGFPPVWFSPLQPLVEPSLSTGSHALIGGRATAALEKVAQHIGQAREFPRYLIGLLIFLGLLGTFWGLSQTIRSVAGVISTLSIQGADQAAGFEALKNGLREPLTGMGTAFSCSMFGLAGSLILGFVELQVGRAAGYVISHIDEWISLLHNRPDRMAAAMANDPDYLLKVLEFMAENLEVLNERGVDTRAETRLLEKAVTTLVERTTGVVDMLKQQQGLLAKMIEQSLMLQKWNQQSSTSIEQVSQNVQNIEASVERLGSDVTEHVKNFSQDLRKEIRLMTKVSGKESVITHNVVSPIKAV